MKTALLAGGTGLIGSQLLQLIVNDERYGKVKCLTRNSLTVNHNKIEVIHSDGSNLKEVVSELVANDVFCCLGTTMKKAKTEEAFRKVDFEYPLNLAQFSKTQGASQFLLVSALGANYKSSVFYNHIKGDLEKAITELAFHSLHIFRPSLLLGTRSEERSAEDAAKIFFKLFGFLIPSKYKAIESAKVAKAMLARAKEDAQGGFVHESKSIQLF